jgi:hypothetical protein
MVSPVLFSQIDSFFKSILLFLAGLTSAHWIISARAANGLSRVAHAGYRSALAEYILVQEQEMSICRWNYSIVH